MFSAPEKCIQAAIRWASGMSINVQRRALFSRGTTRLVRSIAKLIGQILLWLHSSFSVEVFVFLTMKQLTSATNWHSEAEDYMIYSSRGTSVEKARWWHRSYIFDYLLVCFNFGMVGILYFFVPPFQRYLPPSNSTDAILYPYPYEGDTVPSWSLVWRQKKNLHTSFSQLIFPGLFQVNHWICRTHFVFFSTAILASFCP